MSCEGAGPPPVRVCDTGHQGRLPVGTQAEICCVSWGFLRPKDVGGRVGDAHTEQNIKPQKPCVRKGGRMSEQTSVGDSFSSTGARRSGAGCWQMKHGWEGAEEAGRSQFPWSFCLFGREVGYQYQRYSFKQGEHDRTCSLKASLELGVRTGWEADRAATERWLRRGSRREPAEGYEEPGPAGGRCRDRNSSERHVGEWQQNKGGKNVRL